jgi:hypothetical protein
MILKDLGEESLTPSFSIHSEAPFHCLDPNHRVRVRVRVGVRVHEQIRYVQAQHGPQLWNCV